MSKLDDAKVIVDELKRKAAEQSVILAEKQTEADAALVEITTSMQVMAPVPSLSCYVLSGWSLLSPLLSLLSHCHQHYHHHCYHNIGIVINITIIIIISIVITTVIIISMSTQELNHCVLMWMF